MNYLNSSSVEAGAKPKAETGARERAQDVEAGEPLSSVRAPSGAPASPS